jgi:hypothetical protein
LLVRTESLEWTEEICQRMADVARLEDGALLLEVDREWTRAIYAALNEKNVWVKEIRKQTTAERLIA